MPNEFKQSIDKCIASMSKIHTHSDSKNNLTNLIVSINALLEKLRIENNLLTLFQIMHNDLFLAKQQHAQKESGNFKDYLILVNHIVKNYFIYIENNDQSPHNNCWITITLIIQKILNTLKEGVEKDILFTSSLAEIIDIINTGIGFFEIIMLVNLKKEKNDYYTSVLFYVNAITNVSENTANLEQIENNLNLLIKSLYHCNQQPTISLASQISYKGINQYMQDKESKINSNLYVINSILDEKVLIKIEDQLKNNIVINQQFIQKINKEITKGKEECPKKMKALASYNQNFLEKFVKKISLLDKAIREGLTSSQSIKDYDLEKGRQACYKEINPLISKVQSHFLGARLFCQIAQMSYPNVFIMHIFRLGQEKLAKLASCLISYYTLYPEPQDPLNIISEKLFFKNYQTHNSVNKILYLQNQIVQVLEVKNKKFLRSIINKSIIHSSSGNQSTDPKSTFKSLADTSPLLSTSWPNKLSYGSIPLDTLSSQNDFLILHQRFTQTQIFQGNELNQLNEFSNWINVLNTITDKEMRARITKQYKFTVKLGIGDRGLYCQTRDKIQQLASKALSSSNFLNKFDQDYQDFLLALKETLQKNDKSLKETRYLQAFNFLSRFSSSSVSIFSLPPSKYTI